MDQKRTQETLSVNSCSTINQIYRSGDFGPSTQVRWCRGLRQQHLVTASECGHNRPQSCTCTCTCTCSGPTCPDTALGCQHSSTIRNHGNSLKEAGFHMKTLQLNYKVTLPIISSHILFLSVHCSFPIYCSLTFVYCVPITGTC